MGDEKKSLSQADIEAMKKELAGMKNEMMRKELEEIKRERMKDELEEMKAEHAKKREPRRYTQHAPKLSIPNLIMAALALLMAGFMIGTLYGFNLAGEIDRLIGGFSLPVNGPVIVTIASVALILVGLGLITIAKK